MARDILINDDGSLQVKDGDLVVGDSELQEVWLLMELNAGQLKTEPLLGPNLVSFIKGHPTEEEVQARVSLHLRMDNKDYREVKKYMQLKK